MSKPAEKIIETDRLILRTWKAEDAEPYYHINQDLKVIEFLPGPMSMQKVEDFIAAENLQFEKMGYTLWAVEEKEMGKLMGFIGLNSPEWKSHFTPCVEIGWRLGSPYWNKGFATEGAKAVLEYGFNQLGLSEIVSFTVPENIASLRVMEKIGMKRDGDFSHPKLPLDHKLSKHVLYKINRLLNT
jgi:RimJ/RimL family protein N-acetyltransferase